MHDTLRRLCDDAGPLLGVEYTLFDGDPDFVTAVGLRFGWLVGVFRVVGEDDTLTVNIGSLVPGPEEVIVTAGPPWSACAGLSVHWAWSLTNQQGYTDGVRLEFGEPDRVSRAVVEMVVVASAIKVYVAVEACH
jgi:hypothetical protein